METQPLQWNIYQTIEREEKIDPQPQYQRTPVWNDKKKQLLIDSILRNYDLPKFYLRVSKDPSYDHEVVDGQQRLRAIWGFRNNQYALGKKSNDIPPHSSDLSGKRWPELSSDEKDRIGNFLISIVEIKEASELETRELFLRLQEGVSLNPAEKRNAILSNMRNFIAELAEHPVFHLTHFRNERFKWHDLAAIVTRLEIEGGPTDVKSKNLTNMYEEKRNFNMEELAAKKVKRHLHYMKRILENSDLAMKIKWGFVDLYLLISKMDDSYVIRRREKDFATFYIKFENERLNVSDPRTLISSNENLWDIDLYDYIQAFKNQGGTRECIETRHKVYKNRFLRDIQNLKSKDSRRAFTDSERLSIWYRCNEKCQKCKKKIRFDEMQADHITPHIESGETIIENGQALCQQCNASKGAN